MSFLSKILVTLALVAGLAVATGPVLADASIQTGDGWCRCAPTGIEYHPAGTDASCIQKTGSIQGC